MGSVLVNLDGSVEEVLRRLVDAGFFKTKVEAIRAGILQLGREYHVVKSKGELMDELAIAKMSAIQEEIQSGKRKVFSLAEVRRKYPEAFE